MEECAGEDLEEYTDSAPLLPPALHLGPCAGPACRELTLQHSLSGGDRNTVEKDRRGWCGAVAFQSGRRVGKLLGGKSTLSLRASPTSATYLGLLKWLHLS